MSWGGGNQLAKWLGLSESNSLVQGNVVPNFNSLRDIAAPGLRTLIPGEGDTSIFDKVGGMFAAPEMPKVPPLPAIGSDNSALQNAAKLEAERLRRRKGMKSTILTSDASLMAPGQTQKTELLGG